MRNYHFTVTQPRPKPGQPAVTEKTLQKINLKQALRQIRDEVAATSV